MCRPRDLGAAGEDGTVVAVDPSTPDLTPPSCPPWCAVAVGHPYSAATEDGSSLKRLHWQPVGLVHAEGGPVRVSIAAVETNTSGVVALGTTIVSMLTGIGGDDGSYVEMTPGDAGHLSDLLAEAARHARGEQGGEPTS